jgi:putative membrane protein insertion efficiency factor
MSRILTFAVRLPRRLLIGVVRAYQLLLSPHLGRTCRFHPTCSEYAVEALRTYGVFRGLVLIVYRLGRCHPWGGHGYDPPRWFGEPVSASSTDDGEAGTR